MEKYEETLRKMWSLDMNERCMSNIDSIHYSDEFLDLFSVWELHLVLLECDVSWYVLSDDMVINETIVELAGFRGVTEGFNVRGIGRTEKEAIIHAIQQLPVEACIRLEERPVWKCKVEEFVK
jgi:hypothetical protein